MTISVTKIKEELMNKVDMDSAVQVEKVERYCKLIQTMRKLQTEVNRDGVTVTTINGAQEFVKAHPALREINQINTQLLNIERTFEFKVDITSSENTEVSLT